MKKILIQEADESIRDVLKLSLEAEGFNVVLVAKCDKRLLAMIKIIRPTVMVLDFIGMGAESVLMRRKIKSIYPTLPVLAISCNNNISTIYAQFGFDGYIPKPFDLEVLFQILNTHARKSSQIFKNSKIQPQYNPP
uniref:response regulator transcription factor n=1 Tax=Pedobacter schmidteae TaxID=2201271 RepID=UPI0013CEEB01|nr:response regulator [Pedobacter schmidteae]